MATIVGAGRTAGAHRRRTYPVRARPLPGLRGRRRPARRGERGRCGRAGWRRGARPCAGRGTAGRRSPGWAARRATRASTSSSRLVMPEPAQGRRDGRPAAPAADGRRPGGLRAGRRHSRATRSWPRSAKNASASRSQPAGSPQPSRTAASAASRRAYHDQSRSPTAVRVRLDRSGRRRVAVRPCRPSTTASTSARARRRPNPATIRDRGHLGPRGHAEVVVGHRPQQRPAHLPRVHRLRLRCHAG